MPFARFSTLAPLSTFALLAASAMACSAQAPEEDDAIGEVAQEVTAKGRAAEGAACLLNPVFRKDKCAPGLTCATVGSAASGVCVSRRAEAEACDPTYGNIGCATGLTCTKIPSGGGFCKGTGLGDCRVKNDGLDCAADRVCIESPIGSGKGTCRASGGEGAPCNDDLVNNECDPGLECVVPLGRGNRGMCTNPAQGGIGAPCGIGTPNPSQCVNGYLCTIDPAAVGSRYEASSVRYRCSAPVGIGDRCVGVYEPGDRLRAVTCNGYPCYPASVTGVVQGTITTGVCSNPVGTAGNACGTNGVDDCGNAWGSGARLACIGGRCVTTNVAFGESCVAGSLPTGEAANNCGWGYNRKQMACVAGKCALAY